MARSVGVHPDSSAVVFIDNGLTATDDDWEWFIDELQDVIVQEFPGLEPECKWEGREGRVILENEYAQVVVYTYSSLVSVCLVPKVDAETEDEPPQNTKWCEVAADDFRRCLHESIFSCLELVGRFSNGEAVYRRVNYGEEE